MMEIKLTALTLVTLLHLVHCQRDISIFPHSCQFSQNFTKGSRKSMDTRNVVFDDPIGLGWDDWSRVTDYFCIRQTVLKVTPPPGASAILISLNMFNPEGYSFHIADTSTNDGEGGDSGTGGGYNAELYGEEETLHVFKRTLNRQGEAPRTSIPFFLNYPQVFLNIRITRDNVITFDSKGRSRQYKLQMQDEDMFRFDDLYIGVNRLVGNPDMYGMGICGVCVDFV